MKWIDLKLSDEFDNCEYYPTTYKKFLTELNNKHFEIGYYEYIDKLSDNKLQWSIPNTCKLEFQVTLKDAELKTDLIGWDTYIIGSDSKSKRKRFRIIFDLKLTDHTMQFQIITYYKKKLSTNLLTEYRQILKNTLTEQLLNKSRSEVNILFITGVLNRTLLDSLKSICDSVKEVEIFKAKSIK